MWQAGRSLARDVFAAPYRLLPHAVFFFAVLCFIFHPNGAVRSGYLGDTDDYMRINETVNWLQGQGWFDLSHPRLSPGSHTIVHWARLLDLPLALIAFPFIGIMGVQNAVLLASFIVPPLTFILLLWLSVNLAKPLVGPDKANFAAPLTLFAPLTMLNFVPGRVDHHGYEVLVAGFALLCLQRMLTTDLWRRYACFAALTLTCGLWIGTEALPWVLLFIAFLSLAAAWAGGQGLLVAMFFGAMFLIANLIILPLAVAPADYSSFALSWYSTADLLFTALVAAVLSAFWLLGRKLQNPWMRLTLLAMLGLCAAGVFYKFVPQIINGPFADYDDFDATIALDAIGEAQPYINQLRFNPYNYLQDIAGLLSFLQTLFLPLISCVALAIFVRRTKVAARSKALPHLLFLVASVILAVFWQIRVGWFMQFFAVAPLVWVFVKGSETVDREFRGAARHWLNVLLFLSLGFFPTVLIPALAHDAPVASVVLMFPSARTPPACPLRPAAEFLAQPWGYGAQQHTIMAGGDQGPELLFRTNHNVVAANFNVDGNEDTYNFFRAQDDADAQKIADKWHADLVLMCRAFPLAYARLSHAHMGKTAFLGMTNDGTMHLVSSLEHPTLVERLVHGDIPPWLKPVEIPGDKDYVLFEIRR